MSAWPQQQNGIYPGMLDASNQHNVYDPNMFAGGINPAQFNNPQMQQRIPQNGGMHQQNNFQGQQFNMGQVVPSKRSSDGIIMSPGPPNANSRSQTPMAPGTPFQGGQPGQQFPNPYQHLQQGTSQDASPSPTIQNQQFRPPQPPGRMTTQSPSNFTQGSNAPAGQMSPSQTPQQPQGQSAHSMSMSPPPQQQNFAPNMPGGGQNFNQGFVNPQGMMQPGQGMNNMNVQGGNMTAQMQAQLQQRQYQQRVLQQQQRLQANQMLGGRQMPGQMGGAMGQQMPGQMGQQFQGGMPQQQQQQQMNQGMQNGQIPQQSQQMGGQQLGQKPQQPGGQAPGTPANAADKARTWLTNLQAFQQAAGKPFNPTPVIAGRPVNLYMLWAVVAGQFQGSAKINSMNAWPAVAAKLGLQHSPTAAGEVKNAFELYVSGWEKQLLIRQANRNGAAGAGQMNQRQMPAQAGAQGSPTRGPQDGQQARFADPMQQFQQQQQQQSQGQIGMNDQMQMAQGQIPRPGSQMQNGMAMSGMPMQQNRQPSMPRQDSVPPAAQLEASPAPSAKTDLKTPTVKREASVEESREYICSKRHLENTHGGYPIEPLYSNTKEIAIVQQESIRAQTMFMADIRALTLSLQSGIAGEVRYAIDSIIDLSSKTVYWREGHSRHATPGVLILDKCDDLLDALLDCVEEHIEELADGQDNTQTFRVPNYEDVLREARAEQDSLREMHEPGTSDFRLLNATDRLIALFGILQNLSMDQFNLAPLVTSDILAHICKAIHHIGSHKLYLRTSENTIDFYKLVVTLLSNLATAKLEIQSREDALNLLHFLLAFGPQPAATLEQGRPVRFGTYNPAMHRYMPAAVDVLAKILARQEPNRSLYQSIFSSAPSGSDEVAPLDLLTRAFEMAVSFLPDRTKGPLLFDAEINLLKLRKAYLAQGMLAADILASLIPSSSGPDVAPTNIARTWLEADSRWPASLVRMAFLLSTSPKVNENLLAPQDRPHRRDHLGQLVRDRATGQVLYEETNDVPGMTANRALKMLLRLCETAMAASKRDTPKEETNGAAEAGEEKPETNGHADDEDEDGIPGLLIPGDPIPKRETITALLGTPQAIDTEAVRTMDRLYDLVMPRA